MGAISDKIEAFAEACGELGQLTISVANLISGQEGLGGVAHSFVADGKWVRAIITISFGVGLLIVASTIYAFLALIISFMLLVFGLVLILAPFALLLGEGIDTIMYFPPIRFLIQGIMLMAIVLPWLYLFGGGVHQLYQTIRYGRIKDTHLEVSS